MFAETIHCGGVTSRTTSSCLVAEPIVVKIDGHEVKLSINDARLLWLGLAGAIDRVQHAERALMGQNLASHCAVIGKTADGISMPRSKLGDGKFLFIDCMADQTLAEQLGFEIVVGRSNFNRLVNVSEADAEAVLANSNIHVVFSAHDGKPPTTL